MNNIAQQYANLHHRQSEYGVTDWKLIRYAEVLGSSLCGQRLIDYGCGKGALGQAITARTDMEVVSFDPYVPKFSVRPTGRFDILVNTDVLEHIPEDQLDAALGDMRSFSDRCFFVISTRYADTLLDDGMNAHCTVRPEEWWREKIAGHFSYVERVVLTAPDTCAFVTWRISRAARRKLRKIDGGSLRTRKIRKLKAALWPMTAVAVSTIKNCFGWYAQESDLMRDLAGKTVAVVGNARSLSRATYGQEIDAHDVVIRFNRAPIASLRSHGSKTDWIAGGVPLDEEFLKRRGVRRTLWVAPYRQYLSRRMLSDKSLFLDSIKNNQRLVKILNRQPSSGLVVIDMVHRSNSKKIDLYGFDFFESLSLSGFATQDTNTHNFDSERLFVAALCKEDSRFHLHLSE
ncbi:MAG: glycosyltransferase family 29 protein [Rhizobiaceae bacterium]|nr:glycosyltransferase family 29 protein [Rhizobiaceae bacterium]